MDFECSDPGVWEEALSNYQSRTQSLNKPNLVSLDDFYCNQFPPLFLQRNHNPYITTPELSKLMQWKLTRGKWSEIQRAFQSLPDISKAVSELTVSRHCLCRSCCLRPTYHPFHVRLGYGGSSWQFKRLFTEAISTVCYQTTDKSEGVEAVRCGKGILELCCGEVTSTTIESRIPIPILAKAPRERGKIDLANE